MARSPRRRSTARSSRATGRSRARYGSGSSRRGVSARRTRSSSNRGRAGGGTVRVVLQVAQSGPSMTSQGAVTMDTLRKARF